MIFFLKFAYELSLSDWVLFLAYPKLFEIEGFVVVFVVVVAYELSDRVQHWISEYL
jgi:hypothetical protein